MSREAVEPEGIAAARRFVDANGRASAGGLGAPPGQGEALPFGAGLPPLSPSAGGRGEPGVQAAPDAGAAGAPPLPDPRGASRRKRVDADHRSPVALSGPEQPRPASPTASSESSGSDSEGGRGVVPGAPGGVPGTVQVPRTVQREIAQVGPENRAAMKTVEAGMADAAGLASVLMSAQAISKPRDRLPEDPPRRGEPPIGSAGFKIVKAFGDDLEPFAGTVTSVTAGLYRVMFVDGDHEELSPSEYSVALWMALARPDLLARGEARAFRGTCVLVTCNEERSPLGQAFGAGGISSSKFCSRGCRCEHEGSDNSLHDLL